MKIIRYLFNGIIIHMEMNCMMSQLSLSSYVVVIIIIGNIIKKLFLSSFAPRTPLNDPLLVALWIKKLLKWFKYLCISHLISITSVQKCQLGQISIDDFTNNYQIRQNTPEMVLVTTWQFQCKSSNWFFIICIMRLG